MALAVINIWATSLGFLHFQQIAHFDSIWFHDVDDTNLHPRWAAAYLLLSPSISSLNVNVIH